MNKTFHPLLEGAFDFHVHSSPSIFKRKQNDWELIEDAKLAKMQGLVLKSHESSTVERAYLLSMKEPSMQIYGGIVLNQHVGGLNPYAVETALEMGGKVVWFPTISSEQHQRYFNKKDTKLFNGDPLVSEQTVTILRDGKVTDHVQEILYLIRDYEAVLATGHLSLEEQHQVVKTAKEIGVEKIVIQHADMGISKIPLQDQQYFASLGCIIEKCFLACSSDFHDLTVKEMGKTMDLIGHNSCIIVTDYGQPHHEAPVYAMNRFIEELLLNGVTEKQVIQMVQKNPRSLLGVEI